MGLMTCFNYLLLNKPCIFCVMQGWVAFGWSFVSLSKHGSTQAFTSKIMEGIRCLWFTYIYCKLLTGVALSFCFGLLVCLGGPMARFHGCFSSTRKSQSHVVKEETSSRRQKGNGNIIRKWLKSTLNCIVLNCWTHRAIWREEAQ